MLEDVELDYSFLDKPEILRLLFYPRPEIPGFGFFSDLESALGLRTAAQEVLIPVEENTVVGARFHMAGKSLPNILFFHGNGEIVADYEYLSPVYNGMGINFLAVGYRGYGRSTGEPTISGLMRDCHVIFDYVLKWLAEWESTGPLIVMGRSLGSVSALELAAGHRDLMDGLIIDSGFTDVAPLLRMLGIDIDALRVSQWDVFRHLDKIKAFDKPVLIIHAELDQFVPFADAQKLFDACSSEDKELVKIIQANHNDMFLWNLPVYASAVKAFAERVKSRTMEEERNGEYSAPV